jgi:hypothetical protein
MGLDGRFEVFRAVTLDASPIGDAEVVLGPAPKDGKGIFPKGLCDGVIGFYALLDASGLFFFACASQPDWRHDPVAAAPDFNLDVGAAARSIYQIVELIEAWRRLPIQGQDDIPGSEAGPLRWPVLGRKDDEQRMPQPGPQRFHRACVKLLQFGRESTRLGRNGPRRRVPALHRVREEGLTGRQYGRKQDFAAEFETGLKKNGDQFLSVVHNQTLAIGYPLN